MMKIKRRLLVATYTSGRKVAYELPDGMTEEQFDSLQDGVCTNPNVRQELQGQPRLAGYNGPMFNGYIKVDNVYVPVIRYEVFSRI